MNRQIPASDRASSGRADGVVYLDNAATSWPKPEGVVEAMVGAMQAAGANPGRAAHRMAVAAGRIVYEARVAVAKVFKCPDPLRVVFGANVTEALNLAITGLLGPGDHVVTSSMEHNSVMRPLRYLESQGLALTVVPCSSEGMLAPRDIEQALRPNTRLVVLTHASNVVGSILPIAEVGEITSAWGIPLLVDAAQTAGALPIDMGAMHVDLLAFTGHKSLYGPMGIGGLVISPAFDRGRLRPLKRGGTGSRSESEEQPGFLPDAYESGTLNVPGLAGLAAGIRWVTECGVQAIRAREMAVFSRLLEGLRDVPGVTLYGPQDGKQQMATLSLNIRGMEPSELGYRLDTEFGILCRVGLHCSPAAHRTLGTWPRGTVRLSLGATTSERDVDAAVEAVRYLAEEAI